MRETESLADYFDAGAVKLGSRVAVVDETEEWTYSRLQQASGRISRTLEAYCPTVGSRIGLMLPNSAAFAAAFFSIARLGAVVSPLNVRYRSQELCFYLADCQASALLVAEDLVGPALKAVEGMQEEPAILAVDQEGSCRIVRQGRTSREPPPVPSRDTPILQQYTSGSTGRPKRVIRSHNQLHRELESLVQAFQVTPEDRFLGVAPFTHVNGLVRTLLTSLFAGATLIPLRDFGRRKVLEVLHRQRVTYFGGVPYMFSLLAGMPSRDPVPLTSLRVAFSASAPLSEGDNRRFRERYGHFVRQLYGSTETGTISVNLDRDPGAAPASVGKPLPGVTWKVIDEKGATLPLGKEGEVAVSSPFAIREYFGNPEATEEAFRDGFYHSGDLGVLDEKGRLTLTGRKKFLINRGGFKVNPLEVEEAILEYPGIREVCVVGKPSPHGDEVVAAYVVTESSCSAEEVLQHCRSRIADYKIPSRVEFRDNLPRSETGKILRHRID